MSLMSDVEIEEAIKKKDIKIIPFERELLGPNSLDIRLGHEILVSKKRNIVIDPRNPEKFFEEVYIEDKFILEPYQFVLGTTLEKISLSTNIAAQIEGRSSLGRLGIMVHMTAGIIHAGFGAKEPSTLTLEIYSVNPNKVILYPKMKIAQISFFSLERAVSKGYDFIEKSKYVSQSKPLPPKGEI